MLHNLFQRIQKKITRLLKGDPDQFLTNVAGIVHVGANTGQERHRYSQLGLRVLWIEPIPDVFDQLERNIESLPNQRAIQCLVTDKDDELVEFHVANNGGASSSILDFAEHKGIWPDVAYTKTLELRTITLATVFKNYSLDPSDYQAMLLDTQGAELLVLQGSRPLLSGFRYVKTEVADFESYKGCCQLVDIEAFMAAHGYTEVSRTWFAGNGKGGNYYDIVYKRRDVVANPNRTHY